MTAAVDFYAKIANEPDQHPKLLKFCNEVPYTFNPESPLFTPNPNPRPYRVASLINPPPSRTLQ